MSAFSANAFVFSCIENGRLEKTLSFLVFPSQIILKIIKTKEKPLKNQGFYKNVVGRGGSNFTNLATTAKPIKSSIWAPLAKLKTGLKPNLNHDLS